jgi:hypothetical protein
MKKYEMIDSKTGEVVLDEDYQNTPLMTADKEWLVQLSEEMNKAEKSNRWFVRQHHENNL